MNQNSPWGTPNPAGEVDDLQNKILHQPRSGQDIYLTIDEKLQQQANKLYDTHANGNVCQPAGSNPPGSLIITDPRNGEILAMVSRPFYDPNKIDDPNYFQQLQAAPDKPLLNHATQALYAPGSTFKTVTMVGALESEPNALQQTYTQDEAVNYVVNGQPFRWDDYINGYPPNLQFPITLEDGYAYSDNIIFAREAVKLGADNWLATVRKFGIQTPGVDVAPVPFDAPYAQSSAYLAKTNGKPTDFSPNLLAESGFGQGQLLISPLTMAEITSAVAADGNLYVPHVVMKAQPKVGGPSTQDPQALSWWSRSSHRTPPPRCARRCGPSPAMAPARRSRTMASTWPTRLSRRAARPAPPSSRADCRIPGGSRSRQTTRRPAVARRNRSYRDERA